MTTTTTDAADMYKAKNTRALDDAASPIPNLERIAEQVNSKTGTGTRADRASTFASYTEEMQPHVDAMAAIDAEWLPLQAKAGILAYLLKTKIDAYTKTKAIAPQPRKRAVQAQTTALIDSAIRSLGQFDSIWRRSVTPNWGKIQASQAAEISLAAADFIRRGEPLPEKLRQHAIEALNHDAGIARPTAPRGPKRYTKMVRDLAIVITILKLVQEHEELHVTRNEATLHHSACSIVSKALARLGVSMSENRVAEIWAREVQNHSPWKSSRSDN